MRALVTGITGFVGGHLTEHLAGCGDEVLGLSCAGRRAPELPTAVELLACDLAADEVEAATASRIEAFAPDVIFHLAALSIPAVCGGAGDPTPEAWRTNVEGTRRLLRLAESLRRAARVVFVSSSHVYAPVDPRSPRVDETAPCEPKSAYGRTKLAAEVLCRTAYRRDRPQPIVIRSFTMAGPRQDERLMLPQWAAQFARGGDEPITVGNLSVTIDLLDVRDAVRAYRLVALHGAPGGTYNVGSGVPRTTGDVFRLLQKIAGADRPICELRPGRRSDPIADVGRLRALGDWSPRVPLETTIADVWADWRRRV